MGTAKPLTSKVSAELEFFFSLTGVSSTFSGCISKGILSGLIPLKTGCRMDSLEVHSENFTSQINSGSSQVGFLPFRLTFLSKGDFSRIYGWNVSSSSRCKESLNPEPQFPAYVSCPSLNKPRIKDPNTCPLDSV